MRDLTIYILLLFCASADRRRGKRDAKTIYVTTKWINRKEYATQPTFFVHFACRKKKTREKNHPTN